MPAARPPLASDVELGMGSKAKAKNPAVARALRRRPVAWRLPLQVAMGFLATFGFFVVINLGGRSNRAASQATAGGGGAGAKAAAAAGAAPALFTYKIVKELPHDPAAFTQGLQYDRRCVGGPKNCTEVFWESTGMNGASSVREVEIATGRVLRSRRLPQRDFGEGLTRHGDRLYQVTWMSPRAWSYSVDDFEDAREVKTPLADGWGLTSDGSSLVVGDSTEVLHFLDPETMEERRSVAVTDGGQAVRWLNELEWVEGQVWANVWQTECVARIDPASGRVQSWVDFGGIRAKMLETAAAGGGGGGPRPDVFNGLAWDGEGRRLWVTGKYWPVVYQVELVPAEAGAGKGDAALGALRSRCIVNRSGGR